MSRSRFSKLTHYRIIERALQGEFIEVAHKGRVIRLVPGDKPGKLSRLVARDTVVGSAEDLERGQREVDAGIRDLWEKKWAPHPE